MSDQISQVIHGLEFYFFLEKIPKELHQNRIDFDIF